ncbi:HRDC domain-containing protein [Deinococcus arenicola]|uniref:HRDC domain-containing protein n=1 Tax=Deinococcus arenicola TaxID=2994950 RepID=A0ABU4DQ63_9DEIO|nr:HRDC domain-containing protein [Deinococcus sp. ZS9-10]MDV6374575.1 HRDC domain-containing protein [Deinococcus sp. ZS9-10]
MTDPHSFTAAPRPDARLVGLHAERGDPHARLAGALATLEGAAWGLLLPGEAALARQLAAVLGQGTLRVDSRLRLNRESLAVAGLAAAPLDGDWRGAKGVWLLEPEAGDIERARRAGVPVIADATLAPGGGWLGVGANLIVYRDGATLTGHGDVSLAVLFGADSAPDPVTDPPSELSVALALRDVATLPLRLARAARTVSTLTERLGGSAQGAGPTALLLAPDAAPDTAQPPGGVRAAARSVPAGVLLTPGLEDADVALALLYGENQGSSQDSNQGRGQNTPPPAQPTQEREQTREPQSREQGQNREQNREQSREPEREDDLSRRNEGRPSGRREFRGGQENRIRESRSQDRRSDFRQGDRPERGERASTPNQSESRQNESSQNRGSQEESRQPAQNRAPERFTFEAPAAPAQAATPAAPTPTLVEERWEPEIVYSDLNHPPVRLPTPISSGPDASPMDAGVPDVRRQPERTPAPEDHDAPDSTNQTAQNEAAPEPQAQASQTQAPQTSQTQLPQEQPSRRGNSRQRPPRREPQDAPDPTPVILPPDLPAAKEDPAANLTDEQAAVYARLRDWRNAEAKRQDISRFIIASNATLAEIARRVPYTDADLRAVKGMGPERMKKYGDKLLEVVRG